MILKDGLDFYVNKTHIVCNDNEEWAELLCKKNNIQIVCNDNKQQAEFLCKKRNKHIFM